MPQSHHPNNHARASSRAVNSYQEIDTEISRLLYLFGSSIVETRSIRELAQFVSTHKHSRANIHPNMVKLKELRTKVKHILLGFWSDPRTWIKTDSFPIDKVGPANP
eukprot:1319_1